VVEQVEKSRSTKSKTSRNLTSDLFTSRRIKHKQAEPDYKYATSTKERTNNRIYQ